MSDAFHFYATLGAFAIGIFLMAQFVLRRDMKKNPPKR